MQVSILVIVADPLPHIIHELFYDICKHKPAEYIPISIIKVLGHTSLGNFNTNQIVIELTKISK